MHIYRAEEPDLDLPQIDLLTFLFECTRATEDDVIHAEAANPSNYITKAEARTFLCRIAYGLRHDFGIGGAGIGKDVVLCVSSGNPLIPVFFYSVVAAGGVFSAASTTFAVRELSHQIQSPDAKLLVCSVEFVDSTVTAARQCGISLERILVLDYRKPQRWTLQSLRGQKAFPCLHTPRLGWPRLTETQVLSDTTICLLYSSGTTGLPKGVLISHTNCVAACACYIHAGSHYLSRNTNFSFRTIAHLPIAHIAGISNYSLQPFALGGTAYWMPKYDFKLLLEYSKKYRTTYQFTVPPVWLDVSKSPSTTDQFATLEVAVTGAAPMGPELQAAVSAKLGRGATFIGQTWGTTETTGNITAQRWDETDRTGSVGRLIANIRARIVDDNDNDVKPGEPGEVLLRGPMVTRGYHKNADATKGAFLNGFYRTGDISIWRDGRIYVVDRKKELIKYKGLQVAPAELEALLISHPKILDAAVIGVQSKELETEVPRAYIVANEANLSSEEEVKAFVRENLAQHKQLRGGVVFIAAIPKSASGKILRRELRHRAVEELKAKL